MSDVLSLVQQFGAGIKAGKTPQQLLQQVVTTGESSDFNAGALGGTFSLKNAQGQVIYSKSTGIGDPLSAAIPAAIGVGTGLAVGAAAGLLNSAGNDAATAASDATDEIDNETSGIKDLYSQGQSVVTNAKDSLSPVIGQFFPSSSSPTAAPA
ncbi:MAG TPA: hypothetical protein VJ873_06020, partial [bacterium]|nr:hypothetical protein [bacterium]